MCVCFLSFLVRPFFPSLARSLALRSVIERMWMCFLWHFRSKTKMVLVLCLLTHPSSFSSFLFARDEGKNPNYKKHFLVNTCVTCTHFIPVLKRKCSLLTSQKKEFLLMFDWLFPTDVTRRTSVRACVCLFQSIIKRLKRKKNPSTARHGTMECQFDSFHVN